MTKRMPGTTGLPAHTPFRRDKEGRRLGASHTRQGGGCLCWCTPCTPSTKYNNQPERTLEHVKQNDLAGVEEEDTCVGVHSARRRQNTTINLSVKTWRRNTRPTRWRRQQLDGGAHDKQDGRGDGLTEDHTTNKTAKVTAQRKSAQPTRRQK